MSGEFLSEQFDTKLDSDLADVEKYHPYLGGTPDKVRKSLNAYREVLGNHRDMLKTLHDNYGSGIDVCSRLSGLVDRFVIHLSGVVKIREKKNGGLAVIALGGYGRKELNPYSDIDLLFLVEENSGGFFDNVIGAMIQFLWDMNLNVGHSTRSSIECIEAAKDDTYLATSLLEARFLVGDETLWQSFIDMYTAWLDEGAGKNLAMQKIEERNVRLEQYNRTVQIYAHNVKESPGGLRDIHAVRWILMLTGQGNSISDLHNSGYLYEYELPNYREDFDFLLRVRNALHFTAGKKSDVLEHLILPVIAKNLKYKGLKTEPIEKFMRKYYMRAGSVYRVTNHILGRFIKQFKPQKKQDIKSDSSGLVLMDKKVEFPSFIKDFLKENPGMLVKIFAFAGKNNLDISGNATSVIESNLDRIGKDFPSHPEVRAEFHELVNLKIGIGRSLRLMHEHGVLTKLIPEFDKISWHYQYDFYHAYTTDEHSIRVVENLEKIALGKISGMPELTEIMADVTARGALYLAGLLHDVGKGGGKSHSVRGERISTHALERLGFDERTVGLVRFLIREHLLMTHISQRRDMDDEDTIKDFIKRVSSAGRLRMLLLLTFADLMSLTDSALTDWKKALLINLYHRAIVYLEKGFEKLITLSDKEIIKKVLSVKKPAISERIIRDHLKLLPEQYIRVTAPAGISAHIHGAGLMKTCGVWASFSHMKGVTSLTVITRDYQKALSDICGTITSSDIGIIGAQIFTRDDGIIIDTFLVVGENGNAFIDPGTQKTFKENLRKVVSGNAKVTDLIQTQVNRWKRRKIKAIFSPPRVRIHNDISSGYTVIDVFAMDYTGLLYDISSVLSSFNIDIHTAKIGTDEDQIADAFYVRKRGGGKIEDNVELEKITDTLIKTLEKA